MATPPRLVWRRLQPTLLDSIRDAGRAISKPDFLAKAFFLDNGDHVKRSA